MADSRLWTFLDERLRAKGWRPADLARASGVSESRISAWKNQGTPPTFASVLAVAKALDEPLVRVLVEAGMITKEEARQILAAYSTRELCAEIATRFDDLAAKVNSHDVTERTFESTSCLDQMADRTEGPKAARVRSA
jgi:transcriptional regulator with XRE-family HTH domain